MLRLVDISRYQVERDDPIDLVKVKAAGYQIVNVALTGGRGYVSGSWAGRYLDQAKALGLGRSTYHWLDGRTTGAFQAVSQLTRLKILFGSDLAGFAHFVDVEESGKDGVTPPTWAHVRDYVTTMQAALGRPIGIYSGDWFWSPKGWPGSTLSPYLMGMPNETVAAAPPVDSPAWRAGWGGWTDFAVLQWGVQPLPGTGDCSLSVIRDHAVWAALTGGPAVVMNPRTHVRGTPPSFALPKPNPNPARMTDALWWLVCMRLALEPQSRNGGTFANKDGYHNAGENLPDHGQGNAKTDHSIRWTFDRAGPWWKTKTSAHDWTFVDAQAGSYATISKYTKRLINSMRSTTDTRPDNVYAYTLGQIDNDRVVEGYNERTDGAETSGDETHNWHRHDSFRRNIVGDFWAMWKALTIDMGWTFEEWQSSTRAANAEEDDDMATITQTDFNARMDAWWSARMAPSAADNDQRVALRVGPWHQPIGSTTSGVRTYDVLIEMRANVRAILEAARATLTNVVADDGELAEIKAHVDRQIAGAAHDIVAGLVADGATPDEIAAALRVALGNRAAEVGAKLQALPKA